MELGGGGFPYGRPRKGLDRQAGPSPYGHRRQRNPYPKGSPPLFLHPFFAFRHDLPGEGRVIAVSYTHLDVYKRQAEQIPERHGFRLQRRQEGAGQRRTHLNAFFEVQDDGEILFLFRNRAPDDPAGVGFGHAHHQLAAGAARGGEENTGGGFVFHFGGLNRPRCV